jgi:hypothetical protein
MSQFLAPWPNESPHKTVLAPHLNVMVIHKLLRRGDGLIVITANQRLIRDKISAASDEIGPVMCQIEIQKNSRQSVRRIGSSSRSQFQRAGIRQ